MIRTNPGGKKSGNEGRGWAYLGSVGRATTGDDQPLVPSARQQRESGQLEVRSRVMIPQAKQTSSLRMLCDEKIGVLGLGVPAQPFKHERPGGQLRDALA